MADNTQKVVRNYPGNYTVFARGAASTPSNTYEVERIEIDHEFRKMASGAVCIWNVRAHDVDEAHDSFSTLRQAKLDIEFWAQRDEGEQR